MTKNELREIKANEMLQAFGGNTPAQLKMRETISGTWAKMPNSTAVRLVAMTATKKGFKSLANYEENIVIIE